MSADYVRFWGVRGSYPAPFASHMKTGGNTSCVEIRTDGHVVICDAGTGIIPLGNALMQQEAIREVSIVLTHYHWDHISGLPFFLPAFTPGFRINFFGPGETSKEIALHISEQMRAPYFPVETETWLADIRYLPPDDRSFALGPVSVDRFNMHHPGSTYGYRIGVGKHTLVYASDNELGFINQSIDQRKEEFDEGERHLLEAMKKEEEERFIEFIRGADMLIHDSQYTLEDYAMKRGWGHSCYIDTVNAAIDAQVKALYLFHLDPAYADVDVERIHAHALDIVRGRGAALPCHVAREGETIQL